MEDIDLLHCHHVNLDGFIWIHGLHAKGKQKERLELAVLFSTLMVTPNRFFLWYISQMDL